MTARRRVVLAIVGIVALAMPSLALAATTGGVRTTVNGDPGPYVSLAQLLGHVDVRPAPATTRKPNGEKTRDQHGGTSAALLVTLAGLVPAHVTGMAIERPNTSGSAAPVTLSPVEILEGFDGDPDGMTHEATFDPSLNNTEVHFFRPLRSSAPGADPDVNQPDALDPVGGADLVVHFTTDGPRLVVSASADRGQVPVGTAVHFTATIVPSQPGSTFTWTFDDGERTNPSPSGAADHAYAAAGSYDATVTALTSDGGSGARLVHVQVGSLDGGTAPAIGGGSGTPKARSTGSAHGGVATTTGRPRAHGRTGAAVQDRHATSADRTAALAAGPAARTPRDARRHVTTPHAADRAGPAPASGSGMRSVAGVLVASTGGALTRALAQSPRERRAAARAAAIASQPLSWWLLAAVGLAALLGLGVARESGVRLTSRLRAS